jgi:nonribosomal peptide synthetase protein BlmVI
VRSQPTRDAGPATIVEALRGHAAGRADDPAFVFLADGDTESGRLTFAEADLRARAVAAELQARGAAGRRILICYPAGLDYVISFLGCLYAGAIAVPCDGSARRGLERLQLIAADAEPDLVMGPAQIAAGLAGTGCAAPLADLAAVPASFAAGWREPPADPGALALLQYTSGSTRMPRGVMVSHGNIIANERSIAATCEHDSHSGFAGWLPIFHDMGLIANLLQPVYLGSLSVLMPPARFIENPVRWLRMITRYRPNTSGGPNFAYELCLARTTAADMAELDLSSWRVAFNGAEMVRPATLRRFSRAFEPAGFRPETHFACYGLAEATLIAAGAPRGRPPVSFDADPVALRTRRLTPAPPGGRGTALAACGPAAHGSELRIVDPETHTECPPGTLGEVWIAGPSVARGYWRQPAETEQTFRARLAGQPDSGPFLRSGDMGGFVAGELVLTGRIKDVIVVRGQNHYAYDLEWTAEASHAALRPTCGAAFSAEDGDSERLVIAYETRGDAGQADPDEIAGAIRRAVAARHGIDVHTVALLRRGAVPKTTSGKVRRQACRDAFMRGDLPTVAVSVLQPAEISPAALAAAQASGQAAAGQADGAQALAVAMLTAAIARGGTNAPALTVSDPASALCLDSLAATELQAYLQDTFGFSLPPMTFLSDLTFLEIASRVSGQAPAAAEPGEPGTPGTAARTGPLSAIQRALCFEHESAPPHQPVYTLSRAVRLRGPLDEATLRRACERLVARHPALRTRFEERDGRRVQVVAAPPAPDVLTAEDASALTEHQLAGRLDDVANQPFSLEHGSLFRVRLLRRADDDHIVVLSAHHAVLDFWSFCVMLRDLFALHAEEAGGPAAQLPPLRTTPIDQALAQAAGQPAADEALAYWSARLAGMPTALALPHTSPPATERRFRGGLCRFTVDPATVTALREVARRNRCTLFAVLLTAYQVLLRQYSGQDDFAVGTLASGRGDAALADVLGCFVNPVPVRITFGGDDEPFTDLLARNRHNLLQDLSHGEYPFSELVAKLRPARAPGRPVLLQTMLILQREPGPADEGMRAVALGSAGGLTATGFADARSVPLAQRWANLDLTVNLAEIDGGLTGVIEYDAGVFDGVGVGDLAGRFGWLLGVVAGDAGVGVGGLGLVGGVERAGVVGVGEGVVAGRVGGVGVHGLVWERAGVVPDAVAVSGPGGVVTYRGLVGWAAGLAGVLAGCGVGPESRVGVLLERSVLLPGVVLGIWQAGGVYVPLDPADPPERLAWLAADAGLVAVVTEGGLAGRCPVGAGRVVDVAGVVPGAAGAAVGVHGDQAAYVMYTSGSTGRPKGVVVPHRGIVNRLVWMVEELGCGAGDRVLHKAPVTFDVSLWELLWALVAGGCVVVAAPGGHRDGGYLAGLVAAEQVSVAHFVPSLLGPFLAAAGPLAGGSLGRVVCSGEELDGGLRDRFAGVLAGVRLLNLYGPTEASVDVTWWECGPGESGPVPVGWPVANTGVHVLDRWGQVVPAYAVGEMCVRGEALARGYLGRPGLTASVFVPDPLGGVGGRIYRTGDVGRRRRDGAVEFLGRADGQVKLGGNRVETGEVEQVLRQVAGVAGAAVTVTGTGPAARLTGYLVPEDPARPPALAAVRAALAARLPAVMIPTALVPVAALPLTRNGKLDRHALPPPPTTPPPTPASPPTTPAERTLAELWAETLALGQAGVDDDFFVLGGDSLHAVHLVSRARAAGLPVTVADLMRHPTIRQLARAVEATGAAGAAAAEPGPPAALTAPFELCPPAAVPDGAADAYPVSAAQLALVFQHMHNPAYEVYVTSLHLRGPCRPELVRRAIGALATRHGYLRSCFDLTAPGGPLQVVQPEAELPLRVTDLRGVPAQQRHRDLADWLEAERGRGFDLRTGPLARFSLHRRDEDTFQLSLTSFGLDGWCSATVLTEVLTDYAALCRGDAPPVPPVRGTYADFVALEQRAAGSAHQRGFWAAELAGAGPSVLPDRPAGPLPTPIRQQRQAHLIDPSVTGRLRRLAADQAVPLKSVLLAAHLRTVSLLTGRADVVTGLEMNGRPEIADGDRIVGVFNNIVPLRLTLPPGSWADLAKAAFDAEARVFPHRRYPLARLDSEHRARRLFDTMFVYTHFRMYAQLRATGLDLLGLDAPDQTYVPLTVHFNVDAGSGELRLVIDYDPVRVPEGLASDVAGYLLRSLELAAAGPQRPYAADSPLTPAERRQQILSWNPAPASQPATPVHELILQQARRTPDTVAVTTAGSQLSYRSLDRRSAELATALHHAGARPGAVVAVSAVRCPELVIALLAVLRAGCAYLPLDPQQPAARRHRTATLAGAAMAVGPPGADAAGLPVVRWDARAQRAAAASQPVHPASLAYVMATSGTTGDPKVIGIPHAAAAGYLAWCAGGYAHGKACHAVVHSSPAVDLTVTSLFTPLVTGGTVHLLPAGAAPEDLRGHLATSAADLIKITPAHLAAVGQSLLPGPLPAAPGCLVAGGEQLRQAHVRPWRDIAPATRIVNEYGPTEATVGCCTAEVPPVLADDPLPIGRPIPGTQAYVVAGWQLVPQGTTAELWIGGAGLARGYLAAPGLTAAAFVPDPFGAQPGARLYRTGDLGRYDQAGNLRLAGRSDRQVKVRGYRAEPAEVEAALAAHPAVAEALVAARPGAGGSPQLVAWYVPAERPAPDPGELAAWLAGRLPAYLIPASFTELDGFPLTPNGKVDHGALPAPASARRRDVAAAVRQLSDEQVAALLAEARGAAGQERR